MQINVRVLFHDENFRTPTTFFVVFWFVIAVRILFTLIYLFFAFFKNKSKKEEC